MKLSDMLNMPNPIELVENAEPIVWKGRPWWQQAILWVFERIVLVLAACVFAVAFILLSLWPFGRGVDRFVSLLSYICTMYGGFTRLTR